MSSTRLRLDPLFRPNSIAVLGASPQGGRGTRTIQNLLAYGFTGRIYPVNPRHDEVAGLPCLHSVRDLPEPVDLVVLSLRGDRVLATLNDCYHRGAASAIVFSAGLGEGPEGTSFRAELHAFHLKTAMPVLGPNCIGFINYMDGIVAYSSQVTHGMRRGSVGAVMQSGSGTILLERAAQGPGYSLLVSSGNEVVVTGPDILGYMAARQEIRVLAYFMEGCRDPSQLARMAQDARSHGKPLVALKAGRTGRGAAATLAHTGSLAGAYDVQRAAFRRLGIIEVRDLEEFLQTITLLAAAPPPAGTGLGLFSLSGGEMALLMDLADSHQLRFAPIGESTRERLRAIMPGYVNITNPLDATGAATDDYTLLDRVLEIWANDDGIDVICLGQDTAGDNTTAVHLAISAAHLARTVGKPFVFLTNVADGVNPTVAERLSTGGVPYLHGARASLAAIDHYLRFHTRGDAAKPLLQAPTTTAPRALPEFAGLALLRTAGVPTIETRLAQSPHEAAESAAELGFPVAVKVSSGDIPHKARAGGGASGHAYQAGSSARISRGD